MGSFNGNGREQGPNRRRGLKNHKRRGLLHWEPLEERTLLSAVSTNSTPWHATSTNLADVQNGPMANEGQYLIGLYQAYQKNGNNAAGLAQQFPTIEVRSDTVGVDVKTSGDFNGLEASLQGLGMQVTAASATYGIVEGFVPIAQLPAVAALPQTSSANPIYTPTTRFVGAANNQAETSMAANTARTQYNVDGKGVTVGVLSDSVSQFQGGLADSVKTGDLPANVNVVQDGPAGSTDEGRAMLENIHDIAPGAGLAFATASNGEIAFANNINRLASQGASVIVDDAGYPNEPMFQDGIVAQAVTNVVTNNGATYLSAAGNAGNDGYLSQFRATQASVATIGAGRFMNFNPGGGAAVTQYPITTLDPNVVISFEFDQPYGSEEPLNSPGTVTSQVNFYVLDAKGNVVAAGNTNTVATQAPVQIVQVPLPGSYTVAIQVVSGSDPGHVQFVQANDARMTVPQTYGAAGGTFYPTTFGHPTATNAIGVGAVPWWAPAPYLNQTPLASEQFSAFGPALTVFSPTGTPLSAPQLQQTPVVSGADGGNTSFFFPGEIIDTTNPPNPGEPATTTNLSQDLPSFFGTSSAAPNVAAVAALLKQKVPSLTPADIRAALIASTQPLNGATTGVWNAQGGYGLVNAVRALGSIDLLRVIATTPTNGQVLTQSPGVITVTFNRPVNFTTLSASDITFTNVPPGVSASVGNPIAVDDPNFPTIVSFPFILNTTNPALLPNGLANGNYTYVIGGSVMSEDGKALAPSSASFTLNDTVSPRITNVTINGRIIAIQFSEAMRPSSINNQSIELIRAGSSGVFGSSTNVVLNNDPRLTVAYDPTTNIAYVDLTRLDQTELPSDQYALIVFAGDVVNGSAEPSVTDLVGNKLDGEFTGTFPSGDGDPVPAGSPAGTSGRSNHETFVDLLGQQNLVAPIVTSLTLAPATDSGILGDQNTNVNTPVFIGQIQANFPGAVGGLTVLAEFNGLHGGGFDLAPGGGGRGFVGSFDVQTTTSPTGSFVINAPFLPEGYNRVRIVVIGQSETPPLPGLASSFEQAFRIDHSSPFIQSATISPGSGALPLGPVGTNLSALTTLSLDVVDPINPPSGNLAVPTSVNYPALNPATATNISNYSLIDLTNNQDYSSYIANATFVATGADFVSPPNRTLPSQPYTGRIDLTFNTGLPAGQFELIAHTTETTAQGTFKGLTDAAGNPLNDTAITGQQDFVIQFNLQSQPTYITNLAMLNNYGQANTAVIGGPRSYFEVPAPGAAPRAAAPPTAFTIDFSTPLNPNVNYTNDVLLVRSANSPTAQPDGDFGTLGEGGLGATGTGFTVVPGVTVTLADQSTGALLGQDGFNKGDRLVIQVAPGTTLPPDYYRIYLPNKGATGITDIYGNQLDGEFLGDQTASGNYETLLPNGQYRQGISGDGVPGGAFETGFVVVPNGNIVYARPDYVEDPLLPSTMPDGSLARPYPTLAPESNPALAPANPTHDPNGGQNATSFFTSFDPTYDRNGNGHFDRSALYAASQLAFRGPVVVVALPGTPSQNPITGATTQPTFILRAPSGDIPGTTTPADASASVPFDTTLVFTQGASVKLFNASIFVQNQGSALQALGGPNPTQRVNFTSLNDSTVGGNTNGTGSATPPVGGDWGGIVFRSFDNVSNGRNLTFPVDGTLSGPNGGKASSGADDAMSVLNFANVRYAGGAVPQTQGIRYDGITLFNSRPTITNSNITFAGTIGSSPSSSSGQSAGAAISADLDSFREDDLARGPLIRQDQVANDAINGILVRADTSGFVEQTNAIIYPDNPSTLGGTQNYTFDDPLPYVLTTPMLIGQELLQNTGGQKTFTNPVTNNPIGSRVYIQPGMMFKFLRGTGIAVVNNAASINVGSRTYINQYDANHNVSPQSPNFKTESTNDAGVLFTSFYDDTATTFYFDPITQATTTIVPAIPASTTASNPNQPSKGNVPALARWGSISIQTGAVAVINDATFQYGGGILNSPQITFPTQSVLAFVTLDTPYNTPLQQAGDSLFNPLAQLGTHAYITNNNFFDNLDAAMQIEPNGLLAGDPTRPLLSGNPFFHGNVMERNDIDGLSVITSASQARRLRGWIVTPDFTTPLRPQESPLGVDDFNLTVNSVWDLTDITYVLRGSIILAGYYDQPGAKAGGFGTSSPAPLPSPTTYIAEPKPFITLTVQAALPDTQLADGETIPRPGAPVLVKMMSDFAPVGAGTINASGATGAGSSGNVGAGFGVGIDDTINTNPLGPGVGSQVRIVGIPGNETTGQLRVPVIITSLRDGSVGTTVRGVTMNDIYERDPLKPNVNLKTPAPGDGGYIYFGGLSMPDYNLLDPRDGNLIDNADIRYLTRIEIQGGGVVDEPTLGFGAGQSWRNIKLGVSNPNSPFGGVSDPLTQFNTAESMTISGSVLSNFADAAVYAHPSQDSAWVRQLTYIPSTGPGSPATLNASPPLRIATLRGQPYDLYMVNDTVYNNPIGVDTEGENIDAPVDNGQSADNVTLLNNTFDNNSIAFQNRSGTTSPISGAYWLAMDNIFSNSGTAGIIGTGVQFNSEAQYNLYWNNAVNLQVANGFLGNFGAVIGNPEYRNPAAGDYQLLASSAAIDEARSEIGPLPAGNAIFPTVTQVLTAAGGIRTDPTTLTPPQEPGRDNAVGGGATITDPRQIVTLPGSVNQSNAPALGFFDEWVPVPQSSTSGYSGPASNAATFNYQPTTGERDALGLLRQKDPNSSNIGFGSRPYFDIGAYEYRQLFPPHVTAVSATVTDPTSPTGASPVNIYNVGGIGGANKSLNSIVITFNNNIDPNSINSQSVTLEESGGDGVFGNNNSPLDRFINLSGKLSFNVNTHQLTIDLSGLSLVDDEYRLVLFGSGSNVLRDQQGNALDGENTANDDPNNPQLALPSGDGYPGGNFYVTFDVKTQPPSVVKNTFELDPSSYTGSLTDVTTGITDQTLPFFSGNATALFPPLNPQQGLIAIVDISTKGDGVFDRLNAGTALTDAAGHFLVQIGVDGAKTGLVTNSAPLPNSTYIVGADGKLDPLDGDDGGYSMARVRIVDTAGNASNSITAPLSSFLSQGALTGFVLNSSGPQIINISPANGAFVQPDPNTSKVTISFTTNENIDPKTLLPNTNILVTRAGPDGQLGTADDVSVPIDATSLTTSYLGNAPSGPMLISFTIAGNLANDTYAIQLLGTGNSPIKDVFSNPLAGNGTNGTDFVSTFLLYNSNLANHIFVGQTSDISDPTAAQGSRTNPYLTIQAAIKAAGPGDIVGVLPGIYNENITLKSYVRVYSANPASSATAFVPGNPLQTIIRPKPLAATSTATANIAVMASNVLSSPAVQTEFAGFTIASPLFGNPASGPIDPSTVAVYLSNSNVLLDHNYVIDSNIGVDIVTSGATAQTPTVQSDGVIGNNLGIVINDAGTTAVSQLINISNDTVAFNTIGLVALDSPSSPLLSQVSNTIFWENHDLTSSRGGTGVFSAAPNKLVLRGNMFTGNGPNDTNTADDAIGVGNGFNPAALSTHPDALGNFTGVVGFVAPRDPRPDGSGPAAFFIDANFDLSAQSAAIDSAIQADAPGVDFLWRGRVRVTGKGFPGTGPADVGAFEYKGTGGISISNSSTASRITAFSVAQDNTAPASNAAVTAQTGSASAATPSGSTVTPNDLALGQGISPTPAPNLSWVDHQTVQSFAAPPRAAAATTKREVRIAKHNVRHRHHG